MKEVKEKQRHISIEFQPDPVIILPRKLTENLLKLDKDAILLWLYMKGCDSFNLNEVISWLGVEGEVFAKKIVYLQNINLVDFRYDIDTVTVKNGSDIKI